MSPQQLSYVIRDSLYLNITDRCTLACTFCPKTQGVNKVHDFDLTLDHRPTTEEIIAAIDDPACYKQVVFCGYGEPTLRFKVLMEVAKYIKAHGGQVRINTDGLANLANKRNVLSEMAECVDALSISLNAQNAEVYNLHCVPALKGSFENMLEFIEEAPKYIKDVTATAISGLEGVDIAACRELAETRGVKFRQREMNIVG
ncbi:MAG: TatD family nuclease-associated radical SAM protein [Sedimenticola sp.]